MRNISICHNCSNKWCAPYRKDNWAIKLRPHNPNHIWPIDFVHDKLRNGRLYKMLTVMHEYPSQALAVHIRKKLASVEGLEPLYPLIIKRGKAKKIRSDNGPGFVSDLFQTLLKRGRCWTHPHLSRKPWDKGGKANDPVKHLPGGGVKWTFQWHITQRSFKRQLVPNNPQSSNSDQVLVQRIKPHQGLGMCLPISETLTKNKNYW